MDYHNNDTHDRMLRCIALNIELLKNEKFNDICEYDVQAIMIQFLRRYVKDTQFRFSREKFGKFDCIIENNKGVPAILFELKTFLKKNEKFCTQTSLNNIKKDFLKIYKKINDKCQKTRGYFLLVVNKNQKDKCQNNDSLLKNLIKESKKWFMINNPIRVRPSRKIVIGSTAVYSYEVKK